MKGTYKCVHKMGGLYALKKIIKHLKRSKMNNLFIYLFFYIKNGIDYGMKKIKEKKVTQILIKIKKIPIPKSCKNNLHFFKVCGKYKIK